MAIIVFTTRATASTLEPDFDKSESFAQVYTATALFSDSSLLQIQYVLTNLGMGDRNAACKILLVSGARKPFVWNRRYAVSKWTFRADEGNQVLMLGRNRIAVEAGETTLSAGDRKMEATITLPAIPDPVVPPDARIKAKGRFFEYQILLPLMPARVRLKRGGHPPEQLRGCATLEMSRSTSFPSDVCRGWLTFRGYAGTRMFSANLRLPPGKNSPAAGWIWEGCGDSPVSIKGLELGIETPKGLFKKPQLRRVVATDGSFVIIPMARLCRYSFIDELGPVLGAIVKIVVGAPVVYFYRAQVQLPDNSRWVPGILEFMRLE